MPILSQDLTQDGAVVDLLVGVSAARLEKLSRAGFKPPNKVRVRAIIDTGSHVTGFDPSIFEALEIGSVGELNLHTPSTEAEGHLAQQFQVSLSIVSGNAGLELRQTEMIVISATFFDSEEVKGLVGRDFLKGCLFVYDGNRESFSLTY